MTKFSIVIPVHNEEKYLKYSALSMMKLYPDEIVVILDRCSDNSKKIIEHICNDTKLTFINIHSKSNWKMHVAFLRRLGYKKARNNIILNTSADLVLDHRIRYLIKCLNWNKNRNIRLINLGFLDYPFTIRCFLRKIYSTFTPIKGYSGLMIFDKRAWLEMEDKEKIKNIPSSEDTFLQLSIKSKYKILHFNTSTFHLRPTELRIHQEKRGRNYYSIVKANPIKVFMMSIAMLRPYMFSSYLKERAKKKVV